MSVPSENEVSSGPSFHQEESRPWLSLHSLRLVFYVTTVLWVFFLIALTESEGFEYIRSRLDQRVAFGIRYALGIMGPVDQRIKIFVIDDATLAWNDNSPDFSLSEWAILLKNMAKNEPKVILIDKLFGGNAYADAANKQEVDQALNTIRNIRTPIYTGVFPRTRPLPHRDLVVMNDSYLLENYLDSPADKASFKRHAPKIPIGYDYIYGPDKNFHDVFSGVSHIVYKNDAVPAIDPFLAVNDKYLVPHMGMRAADTVRFKSGVLYINDHMVPTDSHGRIYINHRHPSVFKPIRLKGPMLRAQKGIRERFIDKGDIVFIVPAFYTGNVDMHEGGPFGEIPGGYIIAEIMDSVLSHRWLSVVEYEKTSILIAAFCGLVVGILSGPLSFWFYIIGSSILMFCLIMILFMYYSVAIPWSIPFLSYFGTSFGMYAVRILIGEIKRIELRRDFFKEKIRREHEEGQKKLLEERLALGKTVQDMLLPKKTAGLFANMDYKMRYQPAQQMSGDWLYYWEFSESEKRIFIGDVVGKGPPAALPVAVIISTFKEAEAAQMTVEETICLVNDRVLGHFDTKVTSTLAGVVLYEDRTIQFYNAGSPGWFLILKDKITFINLRSSPLGLKEGTEGSSTKMQIDEPALFFTFTDGYMEGARAAKKLISFIKKRNFAEMSHDLIHDGLMETGQGHRLEDDMTMVSVKIGEAS